MYWIGVTIENRTGRRLGTTLKKGTIVEVRDPSIRQQSLVLAKDIAVSLAPGKNNLKLPGYCLNRDLSSPSSAPGRFTVLRMVAAFEDQSQVWSTIGSGPRVPGS